MSEIANSSRIFDVPFCTMAQREVRDHILGLSNRDQGSSVIFANAHVVVEAHNDPGLKAILNQASLVIPDGMPVAWTLQATGQKKAQRYSGPDLMNDIFEAAPNARHFFLGSSPEVLEKIKERFKGKAVGFYSPPYVSDQFPEEEISKHLELIYNAQPDFIWVGLGAPKQEKYVVLMSRLSQKGVWLAVGAAFDFYAGTKPRAPKAMQSVGLEWAFRMLTEPRRLVVRYAKTNPVFIRLALQEILNDRSKG